MILSEPGRTDYDLNFQFLGFDVRVHPGFFLISMLFGSSFVASPSINAGVSALMGIILFFVSILVHELGHTLAFRHYGIPSRVCLYWMGGLAIPDAVGSWSQKARRGLGHKEGIVVSIAGPAAGVVLGIFFLLIIKLFASEVPSYNRWGFVPIFFDGPEFQRNVLLYSLLEGFVQINLVYSLINLLPIYPLDGGQVARHLFEMFDKWDGVRKSLMLSIATCVICGMYSLNAKMTFLAIFCFYFAYQNFQQLNPGTGRRW